MSYLTKSYQSFEDFRKFLTANDFEVVQTTLNTDNKVEYYTPISDTYHGYIAIQYPVQERINPFNQQPESPTVHFEMLIKEPLFTTLNSPVSTLEGHYDNILKDFDTFNKMIKAIL